MKHNLHKMMAMFIASIFAVSAWAQQDYTSAIKNAAVTSLNEWNAEGASFGKPEKKDELVKYGSGKLVDFNQTITIPAGKYKMTAKAVYRYTGSEQSEYEAIQAGTNTHLAKLYAETSSYKYETNVMNRWEGASDTDYAAGNGSVTVNGKFVPNSSAAVKAWFDNGMYVNELVFNVQADGEVKIGIETKETVPGGEYTNISAWTLTCLGDAEADPKEEEVAGELDGTYYLYNVGAEGFLFPGNNFGAHASVTKFGGILVELKGGENVYTISTNETNAGKFMNDGGWMDGNAYDWTFELVSEGVYKLKSGDNVLFWNGEGSTNTTTGADPGTEAAHWMLITEGARIAGLANATKENPVDATFFIKNPNISWGNGKYVGGWKDFNLDASPSWKGTNLTDVWGCDVNSEEANYVVEQYGKTFDNYQELKNIPNGVYRLTAKGFYRGDVAPYIYANDNKCELKKKGDIGGDNLWNAGAALRGDEYLLEGVEVIVADRALRVGVKSDEKIDWCTFDDFRLTYFGAASDDVALNAAKDAFTAAYEEFGLAFTACQATTLKMSFYEVVDAAYQLNEQLEATKDVDALNAMVAQLKEATASLNEINEVYAEYDVFVQKFEAAAEISEPKTTEAAELLEYNMSGGAGMQAASLEALMQAIQTIKEDYINYVANAKLSEGNQFDLTFVIQNPNFDKNIEGWTCVKAQHNGGEGYNGVGGIAEIAEWGAESWEASISQTITGLPNGKYLVKMAWMAASDIGMTLSANEASVDVVGIGDQGGNIAKDGTVVEKGKGHRGWQYAEVEGKVVLGKLTIMVSSSATTKTMWSNADAFELYYVGAVESATEEQKAKFVEALAKAESHVLGFAKDEYAPYTNLEAVEVLLDARAVNLANASAEGLEALTPALEAAVWVPNTEEMPIIYNGDFAVVTPDANYPLGWTRTNVWGHMEENVTGCDNGTAYYNQPGSMVYGNTGAYLMPLKANATYKLTFKYRSHEEGDKANKGVVATVALGENSIEVCKAEANPSKTDWMVGEGEFETSEAGNYILTLANNENTWMTDVVLVKIGDVDTGIQSINANAESVIYDLQGRRVQKMEKGLYIVNGRKVLVK